MANIVVAADTTIILNAFDNPLSYPLRDRTTSLFGALIFLVFFLVFDPVGVSDLISSSVITIIWSIPVPITAIIPAKLGISSCHPIRGILAKPSMIITSEKVVINIGNTISWRLYLYPVISETAIRASTIIKPICFLNCSPSVAGTCPDISIESLTGNAPALKCIIRSSALFFPSSPIPVCATNPYDFFSLRPDASSGERGAENPISFPSRSMDMGCLSGASTAPYLNAASLNLSAPFSLNVNPAPHGALSPYPVLVGIGSTLTMSSP